MCLSGNLVFKGHDREQHWRLPWLLLKLTMAGSKGAKTASKRAELSKSRRRRQRYNDRCSKRYRGGNCGHHGSRANRHGVECAATQGEEAIPPGGRAEMPKGYVQEVDEDQDNDDDQDSEITDQARDLRRLEQY